jgi:hypothetical protein
LFIAQGYQNFAAAMLLTSVERRPHLAAYAHGHSPVMDQVADSN